MLIRKVLLAGFIAIAPFAGAALPDVPVAAPAPEPNPEYPFTLDLRRSPG